MTIVKVQVPITSTDPLRPALVYAKGKKHMSQQPLDETTAKTMGQELKMFFEAEWTGISWKIGKKASWQNW